MVDKRVFSKVLVANRGEIAVRIMRSAQELGLKVVAIYEETDKDAFHIMRADEAVCIGSAPRKDYLNIDKIILAAQQTGAQAIHPGYGFLAENHDFPEACTNAGLVFIGPPPEVIRNLGSKVIAREIAQATGDKYGYRKTEKKKTKPYYKQTTLPWKNDHKSIRST